MDAWPHRIPTPFRRAGGRIDGPMTGSDYVKITVGARARISAPRALGRRTAGYRAKEDISPSQGLVCPSR